MTSENAGKTGRMERGKTGESSCTTTCLGCTNDFIWMTAAVAGPDRNVENYPDDPCSRASTNSVSWALLGQQCTRRYVDECVSGKVARSRGPQHLFSTCRTP
ncbi:hypothetical protein BaRGS_00033167 [Batillaria attramentaria]|uniref:Uncharacterized protein n=1 Tax=Batillaria attramentaria TaxID=370345 RepID=A0ABD0JLB2_9CAEN